MANTDNQKPASSRESLLALARERYPDRNFADLDAAPAEGQDDIADLDDAIKEMLEDYASRQKTYDENNSRLTDLLMTDPSAAEFIQKWVDTGDPRTALVETFGDDLGISEEAQGQFKSQLDSWRERKAANDALEAEAENNWQASLTELDEWGDGKGLSLDEKKDVMLRLLAITFNGMENKYASEDFDLAYNAIHHDNDVAAAREEGEVAGRNAKIAAARRDRNMAEALPPAATGGQGASVAERKPRRENASPWAGIK